MGDFKYETEFGTINTGGIRTLTLNRPQRLQTPTPTCAPGAVFSPVPVQRSAPVMTPTIINNPPPRKAPGLGPRHPTCRHSDGLWSLPECRGHRRLGGGRWMAHKPAPSSPGGKTETNGQSPAGRDTTPVFSKQSTQAKMAPKTPDPASAYSPHPTNLYPFIVQQILPPQAGTNPQG